MSKKKGRVIVIVGPTASGKTGLGVKIAHKFNGEIVSADSRQVYKYMDIGTGKDLSEFEFLIRIKGRPKKIHIPYHLISIAHPNTEFDLSKFTKKATKAIDDILSRGKIPIVVGGTGLYTQALVDGYNLSHAKVDKTLRKKLEKLSAAGLLSRLRQLDPKFVRGLNQSEQKNKRRLARYIEIRKLDPGFKADYKEPQYKFLVIGVNWPREVLRQRIYRRLIQRLEKEDMIGEVSRLHKDHRVSWKRMEGFGLEYRYISRYLKGLISYEDLVKDLNIAIGQFAKRQASWYRRWQSQGTKITWLNTKNLAYKLVRDFLK